MVIYEIQAHVQESIAPFTIIECSEYKKIISNKHHTDLNISKRSLVVCTAHHMFIPSRISNKYVSKLCA
jgi:hypothetical protein